jgi:hypothetical protein
MKVLKMAHGLGDPVHKVWVVPRGLGGPGHKVWVFLHGSRSLVGRQSKAPLALQASGTGFGALGGRGVNSQLDFQMEELWLYG